MTIALWITVALLFTDAALIGVLLLCRIAGWSSSVSLTEIAPLFVVAGVLTALIALLLNLRRGRSEDILEAAADLMEKAHDALAPKDGELSNRRHAWLSAARLISTAETLSTHIAEDSHKTIYQEKRKYWRSTLYDLLFPSPPDGLPSAFYAEKPEHMIASSRRTRDPLSEKSIAYLYRFIRWREGEADPIGQELNFSAEEIERMRTFGPRGLGNLMAEVRALNTDPPSPKSRDQVFH